MRRIDTAEATGRPPALPADHNRELVGDVSLGVGRAARCTLPSPPHRAGRRLAGTGEPKLEMDAVLFNRGTITEQSIQY